jgi:NitT/TauT family transport system substrate-binding protein
MTRMNDTQGTGFTPLGKIVSFLLIAGLVGAGAWVLTRNKAAPTKQTASTGDAGAGKQGTDGPPAGAVRTGGGRDAKGGDAGGSATALEGLAETQTAVPSLGAAGAYVPQGDTIDLELSEYAGYAGIIVANGGLEPNPNSVFAKKHGFKLRIKLSEDESWPALNAGNMAASATTADVLAVYGRQFQVVVPAQIGFSRGADGVVVRSDIKRVNALKGKTLVTGQFTEVDFFIRYLAQEAGLGVNMLAGVDAPPDPEKVNLVFTDTGEAAGEVFLKELTSGGNRLAGCVTWAPTTTEVVEQSGGKASMLTTNRNLLIVADVLVVNRGFARDNPKMVAGLVDGLLEGNRMVRDNAAAHLDVIAKAFKWDRNEAQAELAKVHLSNLPENLAFFRGDIDAAGSFGGIYQSAAYAYGRELIPDPAPPERFLDLSHLEALDKAGAYKDQKVAIAPIRTAGASAAVEDNPLLSKNIRFYFSSNSSELDMNNQSNLENLDSIKELLRVSPGSTVLLRGHVDNAKVEEFRKQGGESFVRQMSLKAVQLSKDRANEVKKRLAERHAAIEAARVEAVGRGWDEPVSTKSEENMRVEVQWFLVE